MNNNKLRGQVAKYLPVFREYIRVYGSKTVKEVLERGKSGKYGLKICLNKKDRYQMLKQLGLINPTD